MIQKPYRVGGGDNSALEELMLSSSAMVTMSRCDTSCAEEADAGLEHAAGRWPGGHSLAGILLAGGVLEDAILSSQTSGQSI